MDIYNRVVSWGEGLKKSMATYLLQKFLGQVRRLSLGGPSTSRTASTHRARTAAQAATHRVALSAPPPPPR